jgi:hypothetical protein
MKANLVRGSGNKKTWKTGLFLVTTLGAALGIFVSQSEAQIVNLSDQNSSAQINLGSQAGMFNWTVDGQDELAQQWFWLAVNNGAPASIDTISAATYSTSGTRLLETTYTGASASVEVDYLLTGSTPGSGSADIGETITLKNTSAAPETFHFYQYSDFTLNGTPNSQDTVQLGKNLRGKFDVADQQSGNVALSETVATPGADHGEVAVVGGTNSTLARLNGGVPYTLNGNSGPLGPARVSWAFEWDVTVNPGAEFLISKDKSIQLIPEPASLSLLSLGLVGLAARKLRRSK